MRIIATTSYPKQRRDTCESCYRDGLIDGDRECVRKKVAETYVYKPTGVMPPDNGRSETYEERCAEWATHFDHNGEPYGKYDEPMLRDL